MNNYSKGLMSILVISLLLIPSILPVVSFGFGKPAGADAASWYMTVEGVLADDKYSLYPYEKKNLKIGFSQFGEMINSIDNVGLEYGGERDPFAPPAGPSETSAMPKRSWNEGWLINITYKSIMTGNIRNVWASATHSDTLEYGNGWIRVDNEYTAGDEDDEDPRDPGYYIGSVPAAYGQGGRKTNGTVETDPIEVLYDGPRRFVARIVNHLFDFVQTDGIEDAIDVPLVDIIITIDFNKDKKEVNLLKDIKITADKTTYDYLPQEYFFPTFKTEEIWMDLDGNGDVDPETEIFEVTERESAYPYPFYPEGFLGLFVQFSNRGEWDLGKPDTYKSYAHMWTEGDWGFGLPWEDFITANTPFDDPLVDGLWTPYDYEYALTTTIFPNYWSRHGPEPIEHWGSTFDVAQIIGYEPGADPEYVGFAAFWPSLSDWRVDGMASWWRSMKTEDPHRIDAPTEPWRSPYIIGEWDFMLAFESYTIDSYWPNPIKVDSQFRGVTAYGLTDIHLDDPVVDYEWSKFYDVPCTDVPSPPEFAQEPYEKPEIDSRIGPAVVGAGDDHSIGKGHKDVIDREVAYQLYEKFKPWDLQKASEKWTSRWVEFGEGLDDEDELLWIDTMETYDYLYLEETHWLPFYSLAYYGDGILGDDREADIGFEMGEWGAYCTFPEKVLVELDPVNEPGVLTLLQRGVDYVILFLDKLDDTYVIKPSANDAYIIFIDDGDLEKPLELEEGALIKVLYSTWYAWDNPIDWGRGSYEWIVAGRDAASVDSLGATMITQAFDSIKDIHVWKPGLDMKDTQFGPKVPFLLRTFGTGNARADYYFSATPRLALKDDWSSTVPIASSNIITVGGPLANAVTEYFNDFTQVIYRKIEGNFLLVPDWGATFLDHDTLDTSVIGGWTTTLEPRTDLEIDTQVGIGIVETYKDINGTIGLVVYGYSGQDTTWTSDLFFNFNNIPLFLDDGDGVIEWEDDNENGLLDPEDLEYDTRWVDKLHQEATGYWLGDDLMLGWMWLDNEGDLKWSFMPLIVVLQKENPGVTALVIEIYYDIPVTDNPAAMEREELFSQDSHPIALIVEELGTISEKPQHPDP